MRARSLIVLAMAAMVIWLAACGGGQTTSTEQPAALDGAALLQARCMDCHGLDRTTSLQKTRAEWNDTVTRMVNKGAKLNADEVTVLVDYLAATYGK